jgi:hypothetical protein
MDTRRKRCFPIFKEVVNQSTNLTLSGLSREFLIHTDASGYRVGSVLSQIHKENGEEKEVVIAYCPEI